MGKRIIQQARGAGGPRYRAPSHRFKSDAIYMDLGTFKNGGVMQVVDFISDPVRSAPLMELMNEEFKTVCMVAANGIAVGDVIEFGDSVEASLGNILPIEKIPEGTPIYNLELIAGDGGKLVRASGLAAYVLAQDKGRKVAIVKLPSGHKIELKYGCRATVGAVAGGGRTDKPFVKAGNEFKDQRSRGKLYPKVAATQMNACDHRFGGRTNIGRNTCSKRNAPPGAKVGNIAPRRTGVRKVKIQEN